MLKSSTSIANNNQHNDGADDSDGDDDGQGSNSFNKKRVSDKFEEYRPLVPDKAVGSPSELFPIWHPKRGTLCAFSSHQSLSLYCHRIRAAICYQRLYARMKGVYVGQNGRELLQG